MFKTVLLLTPVYVTFFWTLVLHTDKSKFSVPRVFLGKFMFVAFLVYLSHFFFYSGLNDFYFYIDPFYQFASLLVYPLYHIYFRLLTIDPGFSFKRHSRFLIALLLLFGLYLFGVLWADAVEYRLWIFNRHLVFSSPAMQYLKIIHILIRLCFIVQLLLVVIKNFELITKYGDKAKHFYSDAFDSSTLRVKLLNYSMICTAVASIMLAALGREFFKNDNCGIILAAFIFSTLLFLIGWLGDRQKALNPAFESAEIQIVNPQNDGSVDSQSVLVSKINTLFNEQKVYLNSKLNILDIANAVGSNRTYISFLINKHFNQNFCSFVNQYRIVQLEQKMKEFPDLPNMLLAEQCGFGSIDSMKRAVLNKTGMTLQLWRAKITKYKS